MADCASCKDNRAKKLPETVPYIVHEQALVRHERSARRFIIALIVSCVLTVLTNVCWLVFFSQYDFYSEEVEIEQDARCGNANYIGEDGDITNGMAENPYTKTGYGTQEKE